MSGQLPPFKADFDDSTVTFGSVSGRSPQQGRLLRTMMFQASQSLDQQLSQQIEVPQRNEYVSHDAWLRDLLSSSLQQSSAFDSSSFDDDDVDSQVQDQSEAKDSSA